MMNKEILEILTDLAAQQTLLDRETESDEISDSYRVGINDGYIGLARDLLKILNK